MKADWSKCNQTVKKINYINELTFLININCDFLIKLESYTEFGKRLVKTCVWVGFCGGDLDLQPQYF